MVVKITVDRVEGGFLTNAFVVLDNGKKSPPIPSTQWFHPHKAVAISRTKGSVVDKKGKVEQFLVEDIF